MAGSVTHALMVDTRILMEMKTVRNVPTATQTQEEGRLMLINVVSVGVIYLSHITDYRCAADLLLFHLT